MDQRRDIAARIGIDPALTALLERHQVAHDAIEREPLLPHAKAERQRALADETRAAVAKWHGERLAALEGAVDRDEGALRARLKGRDSPAGFETDSERAARTLTALRSAQRATMDLQLALAADDPAVLEELAVEWLQQDDEPNARRVLHAVASRLPRLKARGSAAEAQLAAVRGRIGDLVHRWHAGHPAPSVQLRALADRRAREADELRGMVDKATQLYGLSPERHGHLVVGRGLSRAG